MTRRRRQRQQQLGLGPALARRTGDESARFHSKESPGPPLRSTSGFTALFSFRSSDGQLETTRESSRRPRSSARDRRSGPALTPGSEGEAEVSAGHPRHPRCSAFSFAFPASPRSASAEIRDAGLRTLGGDPIGKGSVVMRSPELLSFWCSSRPYFKRKGSVELNLTWLSEKQERKGRRENSGNRSVWCSFP